MSLAKFFELTEGLYSTQQSQTYPELQWSEVEALLINLQVTLNQQIPEKSRIRFIEFLLKYIELALSYLSSFKITQYALQMKYFSKLLYFLPEALNAQKLCNLFVTTSTTGVLNLLIYMNFSTFAKRHLLFVFNRNLEKCDQETKEATGTENVSYIYKLFDLLTTYGDYSLQCDIMETVFRLYPHLIKNKDLKYSILPEMPELSAALLTEISSNTFDSDIRAWLSKLNKNSTHIFSIKATKVTLGNVLCTPHQADIIWLDFNLKDQVFSFSTATSVNNCEWNLLYFPVQYVKSVEVCKSQSFVEIEKTTVVSVILTKPCISTNNQPYWNTVDKTLEIVISEEKDAPTSWLISHVLPKMFGRVFQHRSSIRRSITLKEKKVYRPLRKRQLSKSRSSQASRSKCRSSTHNSEYVSGISTECLGSAEKSPSGGQTSVTSKISDQMSTQTVVADKNLTKSEPTDRQEKLSYGPTASICSNSSLDMTFSRTDSNAVTSRPVTPALERIESLQDNIVTSSNMFEDEIIASSSDIPLGQSKSRDLPSIIESVDFQSSELFSSSPFQRSVNTQDLLETATENLKEDFEVAALRHAQFNLDSDASQKIEKNSSFVMEVDGPSGKQSILEPPKIVEVDSVKESSFVEEKYSVATNTKFETATENQIYVDNLNVSNKEFEVAQRLTQFELNTQSSEQQPVVEYTNGKSVDNKRSLVQLAFKSTNSDFETAIEDPDYSWDNLSKTDVVEKRSLVQIALKETTEFTHDTKNLKNTDVGTVVEKRNLDQGAVNLDKTELRNEDVAQRLTQFELNTQSSEQQPVVEYTNGKSVGDKRNLDQLAFKSTNSDFETAIEDPDYSWDNLSKTDVVEKRSLVQIALKETTEFTHDTKNLKNTDVGTVVEKRNLDQGAVNLDKTELRNEDVAQRLTQFKLNSPGEIEECHPMDAIVPSQQSVTDNTKEVKSMSQESSHSQIKMTDLKAKLASQITEEVLDTVDDNQEVMAHESMRDSQSSHLSPLKSTERIEVEQKLVSPESSQSTQLPVSLKLTEELLQVNLVREPLIKIRTEKIDSGVTDTTSPVQKLTQSNSFIPSDLNQAKCGSEGSIYTQFENVAKRLTQFQLDSDPQLEEANMVEPVEDLVPNEKAESLKDLTVNLVKDPTIIAEDVTTVPADLTSNNVETVEHTLTPDFDKTTQDLFTQLSPDTQTRQTVPEQSSEDVFHLQTQKFMGDLSLKVNDGVFTNETTVDKNVLRFAEVESAVEEIFIDLTKNKVAEIEVMEDRHLSTQELLTVLDKTISQKSLCGASDASSEADACKSFLLKLDPLLDIHSIKVSPVATKPAEMSTVHKCAPAEIEQSQDQKEASCKMLKDMTKITVINSPTTEEPKTILEQPELEVIANYNDTKATNSAADIRKRLINFLEDNKKAEEESLAEKRLSKKRKKNKPAEKENKPKTPPPRILFNENNLDYMDTLNWSTPDYESGSHQDNHHQKTKMVKPKTRKLKNINTSKKNKKQRKRKPKRMKLKSSMQELTCDVSHIKKTEDIFSVSKNPRTPTSFHYDPFWDAVARDLSDIPAGKSTSIRASSDSCSPFFTDGSTASPQKLPELEIEPIGFNFDEQRKSPKIRVLQNIVIAQPRQSPPVAELCHEPPPKKVKLDQDDEFSSVNVPSEHSDDNLMLDAWKAMHKITTWIVQGKKTNVQKVIEFIKSLPHEEGVSDV